MCNKFCFIKLSFIEYEWVLGCSLKRFLLWVVVRHFNLIKPIGLKNIELFIYSYLLLYNC